MGRAPLCFCDDETVLGAPFYIMEKIDGVILRAGMPEAMHPPPETMAAIARAFVDVFAGLHGLDYRAAGLGALGRPEGYVRRQVEGWIDRYRAAKTDDVPDMDAVAAWLHTHMPPESGAALIHNDFKYDNLVLNPADWTRVAGVLDWEMATIGDPMMDLGAALAYWVQEDDPPALRALNLSPTLLPGNPTRAGLAETYCAVSGRRPEHLAFYYAFGLYRLAVIVQQIYARYRKGHTRDPRFAGLHHAVRACAGAAAGVIERGRI